MLNSIRRSATTRNTPTPQATCKNQCQIRNSRNLLCKHLQIRFRYCNNKAQQKRQRHNDPQLFGLCHRRADPFSHRGHCKLRAKRENTIPAISNIPPIRKHSKILGEIGAIVKDSSSTSPMMGSTACSASFSFSFSFFRIPKQPPDLSFISGNGMFTERAFYFISFCSSPSVCCA